MKKLSNTEAELKKSVSCKKAFIFKIDHQNVVSAQNLFDIIKYQCQFGDKTKPI